MRNHNDDSNFVDTAAEEAEGIDDDRRALMGLAAAEAFDLGFGDVLVDNAVAAARTWLQHAAARPQDAFRLAKRMHRAEAIARCAATTEAERRELLDAVLGARDAIATALDATKRS